jgi:hypothetical protein
VATDHTQALVSGDVDGDGDVDLVVGNTSARYSAESVRLYLNNGTGSFSTSGGLPVVIGSTVALALADGDGDGDLDLLVGRGRNLLGGSEQDDYFVNNGSGVFGSATARTALAGNTTASVAFTDLDRDGDPEIVVARSLATNGSTLDVLSNLVRQLDAPALLRIGHTYRLDAYARFGPPHTSDLVLPVAAFGAATIVLPPFGIVGIDPGSAVTLSPIVVPQPAGVGTLPLAIPLAPWLVGLRLYTQGLHLAPPLPALLTNSITDPLGGW